jgi:hypothetical protein
MNFGWIYPTIRLHTWGGFGSQLFAAQLVLKIKQDFPYRRIKVVIHTSGVTKRNLEFDFQQLGVNSKVVDDFELEQVTTDKARYSILYRANIKRRLTLFLSTILKKLALVVSANDNWSYARIKPWTLELRGHYTRIELDKLILQELFFFLYRGNTQYFHSKEEVVIHYRLGDLLYLQNKQPIAPERIEALIDMLNLADKPMALMTDSSVSELDLLIKPTSILKRCRLTNLDALQTVHSCVDAHLFIGSTAKLSLWSAIFRFFLFQRESFLPNELNWSAEIGLKATYY